MVLSKDMKIAICFGLIMGALISICNLCFAIENLTFVTLEGFDINQGYIRENSSDYKIGYINVEPGFVYTYTPAGISRLCGFSNSLDTGTDLLDFQTLAVGESFSFTYSQNNSKFFISQKGSSSPGTLTREPLQGINSFVDNLAYALSIGNLSQVWVYVVPFLTISVLFGLGFYLGCKIFDKIKRAKGGV